MLAVGSSPRGLHYEETWTSSQHGDKFLEQALFKRQEVEAVSVLRFGPGS